MSTATTWTPGTLKVMSVEDAVPPLTARFVAATGYELVRNLTIVPAGVSSPEVLSAVLTAFASWVRTTRPQQTAGHPWPATPPGLAAAWNTWVATRHGVFRFTPARCVHCRGRGVSTRNLPRNLSRTGSPHVCGECRGTRRGRPVAITLRPHR